LDSFPDNVNVEDFIDRVILHAQVETGRADIENGDFITDEELGIELQKWIDEDRSK
jgi:predicted transcriptional regulator